MESTEDEIIQKHAKKDLHCTRNTLTPYENEWTCIAFDCNSFKKKNELTKIERKE